MVSARDSVGRTFKVDERLVVPTLRTLDLVLSDTSTKCVRHERMSIGVEAVDLVRRRIEKVYVMYSRDLHSMLIL